MPLQRTSFRGGGEGSAFGHDCTFSEKVNLQNGASITGTISGLGDVDIEGNLSVAGALNVLGNTTLSGNTIINGNLTVNGTITLTLGGTLYTLAGVFTEPDTGQLAVRAVAA